MKKLLFTVLATGGILLSQAQTRLNLVHNIADEAFANVSIWAAPQIAPQLEDEILPSISFRQSTGFYTPVAESVGLPLIIKIKPVGATQATPALYETVLTIPANQTTLIVANGTSSNSYNPNTGITLNIQTNARETSTQPGNTDILVLHGSTDAPGVDIYADAVTGGPVISNIQYPQYSTYLDLATGDYVLGVHAAGSPNALVSYSAPLQTLGLAGKAITVIASGFLNPANNNDGEAFGLWVALPDQVDLVPLPVFTPPPGPAKVQVIHNAADPAAAVVDVYVNGTLTFDDFAFRSAEGFFDLPAGSYDFGIAPGNSTSAADIIASFTFDLVADEKYIVVANGVLNPADFDASVNTIGFDLYPYVGARTQANVSSEVDVLVFHGSTDAPAVDILTGGTVLVPNLSYTDFAGYLGVAPAEYILDIAPTGSTTPVASFIAPLANAAGASVTVLASGFLNPAANQNGEAFGLLAVFANGDAIMLPAYVPPAPTGKVQIIHNSADPAAAVVDIYVNGTLTFNDLKFREAIPFTELEVGTYQIAIQPGNSTSADNPLFSTELTITDGLVAIVVANGVLNPAEFNTSVNSDIAFNLFIFDQARETALSGMGADLLVFHGATDAPAIDVLTAGNVVLSDLAYTDFQGYLTVQPLTYILDLAPTGTTNIVASYTAALAGGNVRAILASGFLDPSTNKNGPAFGLLAVSPNGNAALLPIFSSVVENNAMVSNVKMFPNPVSEILNVELNMLQAQVLNIDLVDMNGAIVRTIQGYSAQEGFNQLSIDVNGINSGNYIVRIANGNTSENVRVILR